MLQSIKQRNICVHNNIAGNARAQYRCERLTVATVLRSLVCLHVYLGVILGEHPHSLVGSVHLAKPSSFDETFDSQHFENSDVVLPANAHVSGEAA